MCYHNKLSKDKAAIRKRFSAEFKEDFEPIYHSSGFTHPKWPVITSEENFVINQFSWGLIPFWVKANEQAKDIRISTLNAKSETVFELPSFRSIIERKRCLVLSDGFYEWKQVNKKKFPYHIGLKDTSLFAFAGIYDRWIDKQTGEEVATFSILTTPANPLMETIHNTKKRMPLILPREIEQKWLDPTLTKEEIRNFFVPFPEKDMEAYTVSKLITAQSENTNTQEVYKPFGYYELQSGLFN